MNLKNLQKAKELTQNLSILYVEDDKSLQTQIGKFLNQLFKNVYQAYDGIEGIEKYNKLNPDIILTTLAMPLKDGMELIMDIQTINEDAKIIVFSQQNEDFELLQTIDMGIIATILKPFDIDKLTISFIKAFEQDALDEYQRCIDDLKISKQDIVFHNYYKGIPVENNSEIISIDNNGNVILKLSAMQIVACEFENIAIVELKSINKFIKTKHFTIDKDTQQISLSNLRYLDYVIRNINYKRLVPDKSLSAGIRFKNKQVSNNIKDINFDYISLVIDKTNILLDIGDIFELTLVFEIKAKNSLISQPLQTKIFAKGTITKLNENQNTYNCILNIQVEKASQSTMMKYLHQLEIESIKELKKGIIN